VAPGEHAADSSGSGDGAAFHHSLHFGSKRYREGLEHHPREGLQWFLGHGRLDDHFLRPLPDRYQTQGVKTDLGLFFNIRGPFI